MKLTKEEALRLHRAMWSDMQRELGDNPSPSERLDYKGEWCEEHFPNEYIFNDCFCCEYNDQTENFEDLADVYCKHCPIAWPTKCDDNELPCCGRTFDRKSGQYHHYYLVAPISEILALPERELNDE